MPFSIRSYRRLPMTYFLGFMSLIALLTLSGGPAYAEWVRVGESQSGTTIYVDLDTIRRKGELVTIWELFDYKTIQRVGVNSFLSFKGQRQFDCEGERARGLVLTEFSGNMGTGTVVFRDSDEQKWEPIAPDSIDRDLWKLVCDKK